MDGFISLTVEKLKTPEGVNTLNNMLQKLFDVAIGDGDTVRSYKGYGSPENSVSAGIGSVYHRLDGGASTSIYVKESGTGATGWTAK